MKKIIKSIIIPILLSILCGYFSAKGVFGIYKENLENKLNSSKIYLLKNGEYNSYDDMRKNNLLNSYVYYEDKNKYTSVVGITKEEDNISIIQNVYDNKLTVEEYYISSDLIDDKQKEYDEKLSKTNDNEERQKIIDKIINLYKEKENIKLILNK
ncbi:MAG: hypothetical protein IJO57_05595 [Bacilli bacterium]|nr:hypothetical protein [Bacilli bacterium]